MKIQTALQHRLPADDMTRHALIGAGPVRPPAG